MEQYHADGRHKFAFTSRTLNPHEQNYAAHDFELLDIVDSPRTSRCYLHDQKFIVDTDHHPLRYLETQEFISPRQTRWPERISEFDFDIVPIKGKSNAVANGLSWQSSRTNESQEYPKELLKKVMNKTTFIGALWIDVPNKRLVKTINEVYKKDPDFKEIIWQPKEPLEVREGLLYDELRLCMPQGEIQNK